MAEDRTNNNRASSNSPGTDPSHLPASSGTGPAWNVADLPVPPDFNFRNAVRIIGPGAIVLSMSIGLGEWVLGPPGRDAIRFHHAVGGDCRNNPATRPQHGIRPLHGLYGRTRHQRVHAARAPSTVLGRDIYPAVPVSHRLAGLGRGFRGAVIRRSYRPPARAG